jgi:hypothetical protein
MAVAEVAVDGWQWQSVAGLAVWHGSGSGRRGSWGQCGSGSSHGWQCGNGSGSELRGGWAAVRVVVTVAVAVSGRVTVAVSGSQWQGGIGSRGSQWQGGSGSQWQCQQRQHWQWTVAVDTQQWQCQQWQCQQWQWQQWQWQQWQWILNSGSGSGCGTHSTSDDAFDRSPSLSFSRCSRNGFRCARWLRGSGSGTV